MDNKASGNPALPENPEKMRTITLEEHFASPAFLEGPGRKLVELARKGEVLGSGNLVEHLSDIGDKRIAAMDAAGIDVQVLSLTDPSVQQLEAAEAVKIAQDANDYLADAIRRHPQHFAGFATLPTAVPATAADVLERMVKEHGFKGGNINGHTRGRYLDEPFFRPILERAEALKVPLYLHPTTPPHTVLDTYYSGFSPGVTTALSRHAWGWHIETATHVLRLIASGVFDMFPGLQIIIGHMGEALPFMLPRIDHSLPVGLSGLSRPIAAYLRENLYYTFSGFNYPQTFLDLFLQVGADRIMFSADYPYSSMEQARSFLDRLPVCPADRNKIAYGNAGRLLRL